jgi:hypothetical protein
MSSYFDVPHRDLLASELQMSKNPKTSLQMDVGFPERGGVTQHLHQPGINLFWSNVYLLNSFCFSLLNAPN